MIKRSKIAKMRVDMAAIAQTTDRLRCGIAVIRKVIVVTWERIGVMRELPRERSEPFSTGRGLHFQRLRCAEGPMIFSTSLMRAAPDIFGLYVNFSPANHLPESVALR